MGVVWWVAGVPGVTEEPSTDVSEAGSALEGAQTALLWIIGLGFVFSVENDLTWISVLILTPRRN